MPIKLNSLQINWEVNLSSYAMFVAKNKRTPVSPSPDQEESLLAKWMSNQKTSYRIGKLSDERIALMDLFIPEWRVRKRQRPEWEEMFDLLKAFVASHGRFPTESSGKYEEDFLARWMGRQREGRSAQRDKKNAERTARLDRELPDWRSPSEAEWNNKLALVNAHYVSHGRLPIDSVKLPDEKDLGQWVQRQRVSLRNRGITARRQELLNTMAPGWREYTEVTATKRLIQQIIDERQNSQ